MTRYRTEIDALTGEVTIRPYTDEENVQADIDEAAESGREGSAPKPEPDPTEA